MGIAIDSQGYIYIVDGVSVQKYSPKGTLIYKLGEWGRGPGEFNGPHGIAVDSANRIYVVDTWNRRIQILTSEGYYLSEFGSYGSGEGQFHMPLRVDVSSDGSVFVSDYYIGRIHKYSPERKPADPVSGLIINGSFENIPELTHWTYGQTTNESSVSVANIATDGKKGIKLGKDVPQEVQDRGKAWIFQTVFVRPDLQRPTLSFDYRIFANDTVDFSDFYVWISSSQGSWRSTILRDGFRSCNVPATAPPSGYDLGWRSAIFDLSHFKGETIRIRFENRNLHNNLSLGAWTYIDNIRVLDVPEPPLSWGTSVFLPLVSQEMCDTVTNR